MSTHNLIFGVKIRKIGIQVLLHTPVLLYKVGFKSFNTRACYPDETLVELFLLALDILQVSGLVNGCVALN